MEDYLKQIQALELKLLKLKEKRRDQRKLIKSTNKKDFNQKEIFNDNDVVVFNGSHLMLGRIQKRQDIREYIGYKIDNRTHFNHEFCRLATSEEIKLLGDKQFLYL